MPPDGSPEDSQRLPSSRPSELMPACTAAATGTITRMQAMPAASSSLGGALRLKIRINEQTA